MKNKLSPNEKKKNYKKNSEIMSNVFPILLGVRTHPIHGGRAAKCSDQKTIRLVFCTVCAPRMDYRQPAEAVQASTGSIMPRLCRTGPPGVVAARILNISPPMKQWAVLQSYIYILPQSCSDQVLQSSFFLPLRSSGWLALQSSCCVQTKQWPCAAIVIFFLP